MTLNSNDLGLTAVSSANQVNHSGDVASPQVSHADMVKREHHSTQWKSLFLCCKLFRWCAPDLRFWHCRGRSQCSRSIQCRLCELHRTAFWTTCASRSQASLKSMANSGTTRVSVTHQPFLNFFMRMKTTRADLDLDLDKGNVLYKEARKRFPDHSHLTTDELPDKVHTRGHRLHVDMKILSKYGTFGEPLPGTVDDFLDLEAGLTCLLTEVQYALLMMRSLCIAVFSTMSGRCSFFDPHSRTAKSLPVSLGLVMPGTAVMLYSHISVTWLTSSWSNTRWWPHIPPIYMSWSLWSFTVWTQQTWIKPYQTHLQVSLLLQQLLCWMMLFRRSQAWVLPGLPLLLLLSAITLYMTHALTWRLKQSHWANSLWIQTHHTMLLKMNKTVLLQ